MGKLGSMNWYRCRDCGAEQNSLEEPGDIEVKEEQ